MFDQTSENDNKLGAALIPTGLCSTKEGSDGLFRRACKYKITCDKGGGGIELHDFLCFVHKSSV